MKTRLAALASAAALGALLGAGGCVDNRASIQIQAICGPPTSCSFSDTCEAQYIGYLSFDKGTSTTDLMSLYLQVANQLPNNANVDDGRTNTNDFHVDEIEVAYEGALSGTQTSGLNNDIHAEGFTVVKVPLDLALAAAGEVLARIRMRGYLEDGTRIETGDFPVTITVCTSGCVPVQCGGGGTCPPNGEGQLPVTCTQ